MALTGLVAANNLSDVVDIERTWDNIGSNISATVSVPSPTLDLNFAANKSLVDDVSGNNLITFSRASTGTFVGSNGLIQTAASGVPRFDHNPTTGESLGLLVEEARTNVQLYSEQFDQWPPWFNGTTLTVTANAGTSPSGTTTADKIIPSVVSGIHYITDLATRGSGTFSFSVYAKASGYPRLGLRVYDGTAYQIRVTFDLLAGTVVLLESGTARITPVGDGWYRCSGTGTSASGSMGSVAGWVIESLPSTATVQGSFTGDGTSGALLWGAQVEVGAFPTSYIPTTTATVTRAADVASITGANFSSWYNVSQGTTFFATLLQTPVGNFSHGFLSEDNGNQFRCGIYNNNWFAWRTGDNIGSESPIVSGINKGAFCYDRITSTQSRCFNATTPTNTTYSIPLSPTSVPIVYAPGSVRIARLTYYPVRLGNITLQALTTYGPVSSFPYSFSIKGRDILALKEVNKTSTRDFVFIKGLSSKAQPRITTASQYTASGVAFQQNALLKASPSSVGNYSIRSILAANLLKINENNVASLSLSPFSATIATAPISIASLGLGSTLQWTPTMLNGTITSPTVAIPIDFASFVLYAKAGQS
ncbi:hypothetical protein CCP3SC1AL1_170004 [Gammaproteobacteria bacterium]